MISKKNNNLEDKDKLSILESILRKSKLQKGAGIIKESEKEDKLTINIKLNISEVYQAISNIFNNIANSLQSLANTCNQLSNTYKDECIKYLKENKDKKE